MACTHTFDQAIGMKFRDYFNTLGRYNRWANARLYQACGDLSIQDYAGPRPAFFGSIGNALNHLVVIDRMFCGRIGGEPFAPQALDQVLYEDFGDLKAARVAQDEVILSLLDRFTDDDYDRPLVYRNSKGARFADPLPMFLGHMFNHQTHHRGQIHDMLSQTPVTPPSLDLLIYMREMGLTVPLAGEQNGATRAAS